MDVPGGRMKTTLYYGPWQCRREFMSDCQRQCKREGYPLKGCMWLADFKFDWEGRLVLLPVPVRAGSRFGIFHCCCNYPELSPEENAARRKEWEKFRESYREGWSEKLPPSRSRLKAVRVSGGPSRCWPARTSTSCLRWESGRRRWRPG